YFLSEDYTKYVKINRTNYGLAKKIKDSSAITIAATNLGSYYRYSEQNDSSYYYYSNALKFFPENDISELKATTLYYLADIQEIEKLYTGAEEAVIKSIQIFNKLPETQSRLDKLWNAYNLLGIISRELGDYEKSIEYYEKSNDYAKRIEDGILNEVYSVNNRAYVYWQMGDHDRAINLYKSLIPLRSQYEEEDPTFYPTLIGNIADAQLESGNYDFKEVESSLMEVYNFGISMENDFLTMIASIDLSKLYSINNNNNLANKYGLEALKTATKLSANEVKQEALLILADVNDNELGKGYLKEHIRLTDSLLLEDRNVRNRYARIEFETDQIEAENLRISQQRMWLMILAAVLIITSFLLYVVITQRAKNKTLQFEKDQQKANEEIYNLMLSQQDKVDEARANEKKRISQEIHDGILGRLFGTRLSLDSLNLSDGKEAVQSRAEYIKELMTIENDIRKISHDLNTDFVAGSGFMDILSELIIKQTKAYQLKYQFNYTDDVSWDNVSNKDKINIYRIIQESMQNIYKHAEATEVKISIDSKNNVILISIADDGKGFDVNKSKKGIGLKNINSRVEDLGGTVDFESEIGSGTVITINIPYKADQ
ncbi:MAG: sensor histidine kinase, partial [Psychroserpens sp.]|nr:sensor histidine kinase [Psychroserpens sp.]